MNIQRAKEEIQHAVTAYLQKDENGEYLIPAIRQRPILLMGPPGIGKTQIMEQISQECRIGLVSYTITHHTRQSAVGLPFIRQRHYGGQDCSVTEYTMSEIIASVYEKMEATGLDEGILFIDEINCVSETLAPTMLQFLQCKTFGNQAVPAGWLIVAAGNPPEYNKSVREFDIVTLDRVRRMDVEADLGCWRTYARARHLHPALLSYLELRPQNFYKVVADVEGAQFVTARGWEDFSNLLYAYEKLGYPVDEALVHQYLQHDQIAKDVAAYLDLYAKYSDDYGIEDILKGIFRPAVFQRVQAAAFDERLSLVELLISGLSTRFAAAQEADLVTDECYHTLQSFRKALEEPDAVPHRVYAALCEDYESALDSEKAAGLLDKRHAVCRAATAKLLRSWLPDADNTDHDAAFAAVRARFNTQVRLREEAVGLAGESLEAAFDFMEEAFGEGQELVVFVTELTLDPDASSYINENGCDRYFQYNKSLLLGSRRAALNAELATDAARAEEHSSIF